MKTIDLNTRKGDDKLIKRINGALISCIDAHGPITRESISSASKRIISVLKQWNREKNV